MGDWVQIGGPWGLHGMDPSGHLLPLGDSSVGATSRCPRLAGIPPPEGPMTPPPYPPVTAAAPPVTVAPPVTAARQ